LPLPGAKRIPQDKFNLAKDDEGRQCVSAQIDLTRWNQLADDSDITYLPVLVPMICFTKVSFNKLRHSPHQGEYSEDSLWNDPLIRQWNNYHLQKCPQKARLLEKEILMYRKPATYFRSFANQTTMKISTDLEGMKLEHCRKYDRYRIDYDFRAER
jgi:hypothetical protein